MPRNELDAILASGRMESNLSAKDVCQIIRCAKDHGVRELEYLSLKMAFKDTGSAEKQIPLHEPLEKQIPAADDANSGETLLTETARLRQEELASLMVSDPQKYEELLLQGELEDGTERSSEEEDALDI